MNALRVSVLEHQTAGQELGHSYNGQEQAGRKMFLRNDRDQSTKRQRRDNIMGMGKCSMGKAVHPETLAPCCCMGLAINGFREATRNQKACTSSFPTTQRNAAKLLRLEVNLDCCSAHEDEEKEDGMEDHGQNSAASSFRVVDLGIESIKEQEVRLATFGRQY